MKVVIAISTHNRNHATNFLYKPRKLSSQFQHTIEIMWWICYINHEIFHRNFDVQQKYKPRNLSSHCQRAIKILQQICYIDHVIVISMHNRNPMMNLLYKTWNLYREIVAIYHVGVAIAMNISIVNSLQWFHLLCLYCWVCNDFSILSLFWRILHLVVLAMIFIFLSQLWEVPYGRHSCDVNSSSSKFPRHMKWHLRDSIFVAISTT
jgi:hypothetical protein